MASDPLGSLVRGRSRRGCFLDGGRKLWASAQLLSCHEQSGEQCFLLWAPSGTPGWVTVAAMADSILAVGICLHPGGGSIGVAPSGSFLRKTRNPARVGSRKFHKWYIYPLRAPMEGGGHCKGWRSSTGK